MDETRRAFEEDGELPDEAEVRALYAELDVLEHRIDLLNAVDKAATRLSNRLNHAGEELEELDALDAALDALD